MALNTIPRSYQSYAAVVVTPPDFNLDAGIYGITAIVTGTAVLQRLLPDAVTVVPILTLATTAGGAYVTVQLPAGQYRVAMTAATITGVIEKIDRARS